MNCRKCHSGADAATPQGDNWMVQPSRAACGSCHDDVNFASGGHFDQADDSGCASCHVGVDNGTGTNLREIEVAHRTVRSTENNPEVPAFARIFRYEIASWTLADGAANQKVATVKLRVLAKQNSADAFVPVNLTAGATGLDLVNASAQNLSFRLIWAAPQAAPTNGSLLDGPAIGAPKDWNNTSGGSRSYFVQTTNTGRAALDQPVTGTLVTALGSLNPDADGWYTATVNFNLTAAGYAAVNVASMRALGLEGAFTPKTLPTTGPYRAGGPLNATTTTSPFFAIRMMGDSLLVGEGKSAVGGVITDTARRKVVAEANCNACHEWFGFHSSQSRNNNFDYCTTCHNPEMTNSGRGDRDGIAYDKEFSNNLKDLVHAIHGADKRTVPMLFARGNVMGSGGSGAFDFSHVDAFGRGKDCLACHSTGTFMPESVPAGALWSTLESSVSPGLTTALNTFRSTGTVPAVSALAYDVTKNLRMGPVSAACFSCHDSIAASNHMAANVASVRGVATETCVTCHGAGKSADVTTVHGN